jgi:hypothetical protein
MTETDFVMRMIPSQKTAETQRRTRITLASKAMNHKSAFRPCNPADFNLGRRNHRNEEFFEGFAIGGFGTQRSLPIPEGIKKVQVKFFRKVLNHGFEEGVICRIGHQEVVQKSIRSYTNGIGSICCSKSFGVERKKA